MSETRYTRDHEWVRSNDDGSLTVGITVHAQEALGDLVFVELPEPGREVAAAEACAVVESVKAASDVYAPIAGKITANNADLAADPALANRDAEGEGWFFHLAPSDTKAFAALMDRAAYDAFVAEQG